MRRDAGVAYEFRQADVHPGGCEDGGRDDQEVLRDEPGDAVGVLDGGEGVEDVAEEFGGGGKDEEGGEGGAVADGLDEVEGGEEGEEGESERGEGYVGGVTGGVNG